MTQLRWIESGGGPLVLLHAVDLPDWSGIEPSLCDSGTTDYARACAIDDELGLVTAGPGCALVLGDEPDRTSLIERDEAVFIVRLRWTPSEDALLSALRNALHTLEFAAAGIFSTRPGTHLLFDSAAPGAHVDAHRSESMVVTLATPRLSLASAVFQPSSKICALIHRLVPDSSGTSG
ncbi:Imm21 family immunity protein [Xanthomonas nasturtii]|uniref:Imm21 family immunity protein n=1 Tax=Xanthomonas TaxID=338 RepID=UPI002B22E39C|nr:Imm21 family immunity protein [Xanthomonas nasturtii]MEA9558139.1 Imm21 family immunity protein [Xanthomonas nasturtii]